MKEKNIRAISPNKNNITVIRKDEIDRIESLTEWNRINSMTEEEIERNALSDPDALPLDEDGMWENAVIVNPKSRT